MESKLPGAWLQLLCNNQPAVLQSEPLNYLYCGWASPLEMCGPRKSPPQGMKELKVMKILLKSAIRGK